MRLKNKKLFLPAIIFTFLVGGITAINLVQFRRIDIAANANYRAVNTYSTGDITVFGMASPTIRAYYLPWIALSRIAPEAKIYTPEDNRTIHSTVITRLLSFGDVKGVYTSSISEDTILKAISGAELNFAASVEDVRQGDPLFAIAIEDDKKLSLKSGEIRGLYIADEAPLVVNGQFYLLRWDGPGAPINPGVNEISSEYYHLAIEKSLVDRLIKQGGN